MRKLYLLAAATALSIGLAFGALAQVPPGPINLPNTPLGTLITLTSANAGTTASAQQNNLYMKGALCTFNQSAHTNSPSSTFTIQMYDQSSNSYQSLVTSGAITADATPTTIVVYPGIQTSSLPTGMVALNGRLTRKWRVSTTVGGTTPVVTATIGCELLP